jgi:hemerythrin-like domain-containing protein
MPPIKRHPALISFSRDHHNGLLLVWKVREGERKNIEPKRVADYVNFAFNSELEPHFNDEEKWLFPELTADNPGRMKAEADHRFIRQLVNDLHTMPEPALLSRFADALEAHIRFEERELFNEIQKIPEERLVPIAGRFAGHVCTEDGWSDEFWK